MNHLKLIYTPSHLDMFELDYIKSLNPIESNVILVVPEQFSFDAEKYLVEKIGLKGLFNVRIYGLKKLIYEFSYLVNVSRNDIISDFAKTLLMTEILKKIDGKLSFYKGSYKSKSYIEMLFSQVDNFRKDEISDKELFEMSEDCKISNPLLSKKLYELSLILIEYNEYFSGSKIDEIELTKRLTEFFLSDEYHKNNFMLDDYSLVIDGFSGMSQSELNLILAMASRSEDSFIRLLLAKKGVSSRYSNKFRFQIEKAFQTIKEPYSIEEIIDEPSQSEKNAFAFADLFEYKERIFNEKPNFEIVSAKDKDEEISYISEDILEKIRDEKAIWSDFAIVCASQDTYEYNIDKIFQNYKIPYFRDENISISGYNFLMFIVYSLKAVKNNFLNKNVIELIKLASYLTMDELEFKNNYNLSSDIERYVLEMNINYDRWFNDDYWKFLDSENRDEIIKYKNKILFALKDLKDNLEKNDNLKLKLDCLNKYLKEFDYEYILDKKIEYYSDIEDEDNFKKYSSIKSSLEEIFEQINYFAGDFAISTDYFIDLFLSAISVYKQGQTPPNNMKVLFGSIERSRFLGVKYLYVIGANDGILPSSISRSPVFTASEIAFLDKASDFDFKTASKFMDKEVFDLYEKIILASEKTIFTYSRTNDMGDEMFPSNWIKGLVKAYDIEIKEAEISLNSVFETGVKTAFYKKIFMENRPWDFSNKKIDGFDAYFTAENFLNTNLTDKKDEYIERLASKLSVSRLEKQALCPYGFFVEYALKPIQNSYNEIDYAMFGSVYHRALEYFVNDYVKSSDKDKFKENSEKILKEKFEKSQLEEEILQVNSELKNRFRYLEPSIKYVSKAVINQLEHGKECKMLSISEKDFKHIFKNGEKELLIRGKIDRLDIIEYGNKSYLRVVDYKTGQKTFDLNDVKDGLQMQLLTYLKSLLDGEYKDENIEVLGAFYHSIRENFSNVALEDAESEVLSNYKLDGRYVNNEEVLLALDKDLAENGVSSSTNIKLTSKGKLSKTGGTVISKDEFDELFEITEENIWRLLSEIESADISVKDHDSKDFPCPYCGYNGILKLDKMKYRDMF